MWHVQVLDKCQNPVSSGQTVKVVLDGFRLQDKTGSERAVSSSPIKPSRSSKLLGRHLLVFKYLKRSCWSGEPVLYFSSCDFVREYDRLLTLIIFFICRSMKMDVWTWECDYELQLAMDNQV